MLREIGLDGSLHRKNPSNGVFLNISIYMYARRFYCRHMASNPSSEKLWVCGSIYPNTPLWPWPGLDQLTGNAVPWGEIDMVVQLSRC